MRIATFALISFGLLALTERGGTVRPVSINSKAEARTRAMSFALADAEYIGLVPGEQRFVTQPGRVFVVLAIGECKPGDPIGGIFELRPPTPDFVELIPLCRGNGHVLGALVINPANKDAGSHIVNVNTHGCDGTPQEYTFTVKVKNPFRDQS